MHDISSTTAPLHPGVLLRETPERAVPVASGVGKPALPPPSSEFLVMFVLAMDAVAVVAALFFASGNDHHVHFHSVIYEILVGRFSGYILVGMVLYLIVIGVLEGYHRQHFFSYTRQLHIVLKACSQWLVAFLALSLAFKLDHAISRYFFVFAFFNSLVALSAWRLAFCHFMLESKWQQVFRKQVLVIGWSKESHSLFERIRRDPGHAYDVIGCTPSAHGKFWVTPPREVHILGDYNSVPDIIRERRPNIAIMADLDPVMGEIIALANLCMRENVQFKVIPSYFQTLSSGLHLEHVSGVPVLGVSKLPLDHVFNRIVKRAIDVVGSIVGLVLSAPLVFIFGILSRRESPGPIFYSQSRSGLGCKEFRIVKLRSMKLDSDKIPDAAPPPEAESVGYGIVFTKPNDPRCLKIGGFMRKWNIDELPQFWNVLMGDMSLVGPRPERTEYVETLREEITHYNARHFAKPGLTGHAQVNGLRGNTDLTARLKYDLYYLENWSVLLDFYIMFRTFLRQKNAY
jgi:exopolysaccharide biosynthesis polyprenyl glycosylphosphotransferase